MASPKKKFKTVILLILAVGLFLRLYKIEIPLLEFYPSRQIQTAEIARNFYREGMSILSPAVHYLGPGPGTFLVEFPLYNYIVASIYQITGGINEVWGRLFSILGWIISCYFLLKIAKKYVGNFAANISLFFYSLSPLSILVSRSFQPDQWMLTFSLGSIFYLLGRHVFLSALLASLAILTKIPAALFTLIPAVYLLWLDRKRSYLIYGYLLISTLPSILWYLYVINVNKGGILFGSTRIEGWFGFEVFLNPKYWSTIFGFEMNLVILPIGMILFTAGLFTKLKPSQRFFYIWLASIVFYFLIFNKHNMTHEYYHLPFLPIAAIFIGIVSGKIMDNLKNTILPKRFLLLIFSILVFILMLPPTLQRAYKPIDRFKNVPLAAKIIQENTNSEDLIIGSMDAGPTLVYYSSRSGWSFEVNRSGSEQEFAFYGVKNMAIVDPVKDIENLRRQGAVLFASANKNQFQSNTRFANYMYSNYRVLEETDSYIIFDIVSPLSGR